MSDLARIEAEVSSASPTIKRLSNKRLALIVKAGFQKIRKCLPYIVELRQRFADLPRGGANIMGCTTWKTFCITHLHRTDRALRYALAEANEETAAAEIVKPKRRTIADVDLWLREALQNGPQPRSRFTAPAGYISSNLPVPYGGKPTFKALQESVQRLGIVEERSGKRGGLYWRLPDTPLDPVTIDRTPTSFPPLPKDEAYEKLKAEQMANLVAIRKAGSARLWLSKMLQDFERLKVGTVEPEEIEAVLRTSGDREILCNCKEWLEKVSTCATAMIGRDAGRR
jgi:hypothetical protein